VPFFFLSVTHADNSIRFTFKRLGIKRHPVLLVSNSQLIITCSRLLPSRSPPMQWSESISSRIQFSLEKHLKKERSGIRWARWEFERKSWFYWLQINWGFWWACFFCCTSFSRTSCSCRLLGSVCRIGRRWDIRFFQVVSPLLFGRYQFFLFFFCQSWPCCFKIFRTTTLIFLLFWSVCFFCKNHDIEGREPTVFSDIPLYSSFRTEALEFGQLLR
jgi:hypothetical protein